MMRRNLRLAIALMSASRKALGEKVVTAQVPNDNVWHLAGDTFARANFLNTTAEMIGANLEINIEHRTDFGMHSEELFAGRDANSQIDQRPGFAGFRS